MRYDWKRWLSGLLSAVMMFSLVPAFAVEEAMETVETALEAAENPDGAREKEVQENAPDAQAESQNDAADMLSVSAAPSAPKPRAPIAEIAYRFSDDESWTTVSADSNANGRKFDETGVYSIELSEEQLNAPISFLVWNVGGNSEEISKDAEGKDFSFEEAQGEKSVISIKGYAFSAYVPSMETVSYYYTYKNEKNQNIGVFSAVTSDEDWQRAHPKSCEYQPSGATLSIALVREQTFPVTVYFENPDGLEFDAASAKDVEINGNEVTFQSPESSVTVKRRAAEYVLTASDPWYGEITYTLPDGKKTTLCKDAAIVKQNQDEEGKPKDKNHIYVDWRGQNPDEREIALGENDAYPFAVTFDVRGVSDSAKMFSDASPVADVEINGNEVKFLTPEASVKVGGATAFKTSDSRHGEVSYSLNYVDSKTLTPDKAWADKEANQDAYVYPENGTSHVIELTEDNTFPVDVTFSLPRDGKAPAFSDFRNASLKTGSENVVSFEKQDASVVVNGYTVSVHSPFVGAVRYSVENAYGYENPWARPMVVGTDENYATKRKTAAEQDTAEAIAKAKKDYPDSPVDVTPVKPDYVAFVDGAHKVELNRNEYFPAEVSFTRWDEQIGWDTANKITKTFNGVQTNGAESVETVFDRRFSIHADWLEEVTYQWSGESSVTVGYDAEKAKSRSDYELFDEYGNFYIDPPSDYEKLVFPCKVKFTVRDPSGASVTTEETFENSESVAVIRGHMFSLRPVWKGEVVYRLMSGASDTAAQVASKTVGSDSAWAETHADYALAVEETVGKTEGGKDIVKRSYGIVVPESAKLSFPVTVRFHMRDSKNETSVQFKNLNDTHMFGGITFSLHPEWLDTVTYSLSWRFKAEDGKLREAKSGEITVGTDTEQAEAAAKAALEVPPEQLKENPLANRPTYVVPKDGKRVEIELEDDAFYPYGIKFTEKRLKKGDGDTLTPNYVTRTVWFEGAGDDYAQKVGGYTFVVKSERKDPNKLVGASLWINSVKGEDNKRIGGIEVPFVNYSAEYPDSYYPADSSYWNNEWQPQAAKLDSYWTDIQAEKDYQATLQSLLPLRERRLYINLKGFFPWELEHAELELKRAVVDGTPQAQNAVAWGEIIEGSEQGIAKLISSGKYGIIKDSGEIKLADSQKYHDGLDDYEMIVGQLDQFDINDMRYLVTVSTKTPVFSGLDMQAAYADASQSGIRIKQNPQYASQGGSYIDPKSKEKRSIDAYRFEVNEQWKDGSVYLTMKPKDSPDFKPLTVAVYEGAYLTVDAYKEAKEKAARESGKVDVMSATDITEKVWDKNLDSQPIAQHYAANLVSGNNPDAPLFTVVWFREGVPVEVMPFQILVRVTPDAEWSGEGGVDGTPADRIWRYSEPQPYDDQKPQNTDGILLPHTSNTTDGSKWTLNIASMFKPQEPEPYDVNVYHYEIPDPKDNDDTKKFKGTGLDRFYVSAKYYHHTPKGALDKDGNEVKEAFDEPSAEAYSYYDTQGDQENGTAIWQKYGVKVYAGSKPYANLEEAQTDKDARDVTAQIFTSQGYGAQYTATIYFSFFNASGGRFACQGVQIESEVRIEYQPLTLNGDSHFKSDPDEKPKEESIIYSMPAESYPPEGMYSLKISFQRDYKDLDWKAEGATILACDQDYSKLSLAQAKEKEDSEDVTEKILSERGYSANYAFGVHIHIYDKAGKLLSHRKVITEAYQSPAASADTWFQMQSALKETNGAPGSAYNGYAMPYTSDAYYSNGYQTIFIMDQKPNEETGELEYVPVELGSAFYPKFWSADDATIYALHNEGGDQQISEQNRYVFGEDSDGDGQPDSCEKLISYSAAAANKTHLRNYWITFLTQQSGGASLFINTANDESHWKGGVPQREVFIKDAGGSHDIFFANIGDERLTDLQVTLSNEDAVKLDNYWKLYPFPKNSDGTPTANPGTRYLNAYTTVDHNKDGVEGSGENIAYGGLPNVAKIRIFATDPKTARDIDTDLTISGKSENGAIISKTIHLTGRVGNVRIDSPLSDTLRPAVKYVPYANLIHTTNIYGGQTVSFEKSFSVPQGVTDGASETYNGTTYRHYYRLPNGMEIRPNGEIYGAPLESGLFTFTVTASFSYGGTVSSDSRTYTLEVKENTDYNVWMENDWHRDGFEWENNPEWDSNPEAADAAKRDDEEFGVSHWIPNIEVTTASGQAEFDHGAPYVSPESVESNGKLDENDLANSDDRRRRDDNGAFKESVKLSKYKDVAFVIKNYNDNYQNGEGDYDWFITLWRNGEPLKGYRIENVSRQSFANDEEGFKDYVKALSEEFNKNPELRSVYDFYYGRGSLASIATAETMADRSSNASIDTWGGEFREHGNKNNAQRTAAQKSKTAGKTKSKSKSSQSNDNKNDNKKPTYTGGGGGGGGSSSTTIRREPSYSITTQFDGAQGKSVKTSAQTAKQGAKITITIDPYQGYLVNSVSVVYGKKQNTVRVSGTGNQRTFVMPGANVTVKVTFRLQGPLTFSVRAGAATGGSVSFNTTSAQQGAEIIATVTPQAGRVPASLTVTAANGANTPAYEIERNVETNVAKYRFYMPAANVTTVPQFAWERLAEFQDIDGSM